MTRELLEAINIQAKREGYFLPVLRAIVFEQLGQNFPAKHLLDILDDHRGGSWGSDQGDGLLPAPSLRSPDIRHGSIDFSQAEVRYYTPTELKKHRLADGDILVIKSNGSLDLVGKSQLYSTADDAPPATASNFVLILRPDRTQVNPTYLDCFLKSPQALVWRVDKQRTTTGLRNLDTNGYLATRIPLPPAKETQKEIVEIIDSIADGMWRENSHFDIRLAERAKQISDMFEKLEVESSRQQSLLTKLKQAILQEAIQGKLTADWRAAHPDVEPASQLLHRIQAEKARLIAAKKLRPEKPLPKITPAEIPFEIPKGWEWCRLGDINMKFMGGEAYQSGSILSSGANQVVRIGNIKPDTLELSKRPAFISDSLAEETSGSRLQPGDILVTMTGTYQKKDYCFTVLLTEEHFADRRLYQNQRVGCFRLHPEIHKPFLIRALKLAPLLDPVFESSTGAANQANISKGALLNILIPLPPLAEQTAIVERVEALMTTCRALEAEIEHARTHAAQLLQAVLKEAFAPASHGK